MRKPFYEEDFNVEKYVNNRILEMDSISDRILYKQMAESFDRKHTKKKAKRNKSRRNRSRKITIEKQ